MSHPTGSIERIAANPRNPWSRLRAAMDLSESGEAYETARVLETLRYKDSVNEELLTYLRELVAARTVAERLKINIPSDYNRGLGRMLHPPFRRIPDSPNYPKHFPSGLALPAIVGNANDHEFIEEAATLLSADAPSPAIDVFYSYGGDQSLEQLLKSLRQQRYTGRFRLHLLGATASAKAGARGLEIIRHQVDVPSAEANELLLRASGESDVMLFLSGSIELEPAVLQRIAHVAAASDRVVHALVEQEFSDTVTPFTHSVSRSHLGRSYPFRDVAGLNFAVTAKLFRQAGGFDVRFNRPFDAGRELCFRLYNEGCYFRPITTPKVRDFRPEGEEAAADDKLFKQLSPNHWDRKRDGTFEVPKVSVYIPAYNAARYIVGAVESVLDQDVQDLEVCIADDGSTDDTLDVLEQRFGGNPKVRWSANANGGIGFASNRAIAMARGIYIGQLDSDDCLKPGAIRTLATYLDENPDAACCYSSAERIDAAGDYVQNEYSWPVFSREKMMVTSITHHFRMFRRQAWERTEKFREDVINAVDYDIFLKASEVGRFNHIEEFLYQRRWHGSNTSNVNEAFQTRNAHRVQREALKRLGLFNFWDIHVEDPDNPRLVTYRRRPGKKLVMFWPYYRANAYQRMLYAPNAADVEICAGTIDAALREIDRSANPEDHIFHLHWLNYLFQEGMSEEDAQAAAEDLLAKVELFKALGGTVVWTIHNKISHEVVHRDVELDLSARLAQAVDVLHFHSASSIPEVAEEFAIPEEKVRLARHGHFIGAYPDLVAPDLARQYLGLAPDDDVMVFTGQVRKYKGIDTLLAAFRNVLRDRPKALLLIAGAAREDPLSNLDEPLSDFEKSRIRIVDRFIDDSELQVYLRAADFAVYPYRQILTSSSLMLALSFDLPVIIPEVGMARDVLAGTDAGIMYDGSADELEAAIVALLDAKAGGKLAEMARNARRAAEAQPWQRLF